MNKGGFTIFCLRYIATRSPCKCTLQHKNRKFLILHVLRFDMSPILKCTFSHNVMQAKIVWTHPKSQLGTRFLDEVTYALIILRQSVITNLPFRDSLSWKQNNNVGRSPIVNLHCKHMCIMHVQSQIEYTKWGWGGGRGKFMEWNETMCFKSMNVMLLSGPA